MKHSLDDWPPLTDDEVRALGYEPVPERGWVPLDRVSAAPSSEPQIRNADDRPQKAVREKRATRNPRSGKLSTDRQT
jgi:hypothetical protein